MGDVFPYGNQFLRLTLLRVTTVPCIQVTSTPVGDAKMQTGCATISLHTWDASQGAIKNGNHNILGSTRQNYGPKKTFHTNSKKPVPNKTNNRRKGLSHLLLQTDIPHEFHGNLTPKRRVHFQRGYDPFTITAAKKTRLAQAA